jgi:hypothetical protein
MSPLLVHGEQKAPGQGRELKTETRFTYSSFRQAWRYMLCSPSWRSYLEKIAIPIPMSCPGGPAIASRWNRKLLRARRFRVCSRSGDNGFRASQFLQVPTVASQQPALSQVVGAITASGRYLRPVCAAKRSAQRLSNWRSKILEYRLLVPCSLSRYPANYCGPSHDWRNCVRLSNITVSFSLSPA